MLSFTFSKGGELPKDDPMTRGRGGWGSGYPPKMMSSFMNSPLLNKVKMHNEGKDSRLRIKNVSNLR